MPVSVTMPQLGESVTEGTVTRWLKNIGDTVAMDEPLLEISTDKVDAEIPAPTAGILVEILVQEGQTVAINTIVARIETDASAAARASASRCASWRSSAASRSPPESRMPPSPTTVSRP